MADTVTLPDVNVSAPAPSPATVGSGQSKTYAKRVLQFTFQLGQGAFGASGQNTLTLNGLRAFAQVNQANIPSGGMAMIRIQGMTLDHINTLTQAGLYYKFRHNLVGIQAGDEGGQLTTVFTGVIYEAYPDFSNQPDVAFVILASPSNELQLKPAQAISFNGATKITTALQKIIQPAGLMLEANNVDVVLASPYFPGTVWQQILRAVKAANIFAHLDAPSKTLAIWPKSGQRDKSVPMISPDTGMIGYPEFMQNRIKVRTLFDPKFVGCGPGVPILVQSQLSAANGNQWVLNEVTLNLSSESPGGPWEMILQASPKV